MGELVEIYRAKDVPQAHLMKSALEARGIKVLLDNMDLQIGMGELAPGYGTAPRLLVDETQAVEARKIVMELDESYKYDSGTQPDCGQD